MGEALGLKGLTMTGKTPETTLDQLTAAQVYLAYCWEKTASEMSQNPQDYTPEESISRAHFYIAFNKTSKTIQNILKRIWSLPANASKIDIASFVNQASHDADNDNG